MGAASLVLGIISCLIALFASGFGWLGAILGIIGCILASMAKRNGQGGIATAGQVLSILGIIFGLILYVACVACVGGLAAMS